MAMNARPMASAFPTASMITKPSVLPHRTAVCNCRFRRFSLAAGRRLGIRNSAKAPSSTSEATSTPQISPAYKISQIGSPLLWIGVGIGLSAWFSVMATKLKRHAIHKAFKSLMGEEAEANGQFNAAAFAAGSDLVSLPEADAKIQQSAEDDAGSEIISSENDFNVDEEIELEE